MKFKFHIYWNEYDGNKVLIIIVWNCKLKRRMSLARSIVLQSKCNCSCIWNAQLNEKCNISLGHTSYFWLNTSFICFTTNKQTKNYIFISFFIFRFFYSLLVYNFFVCFSIIVLFTGTAATICHNWGEKKSNYIVVDAYKNLAFELREKLLVFILICFVFIFRFIWTQKKCNLSASLIFHFYYNVPFFSFYYICLNKQTIV